jgi:glycosyltransferase involved in cell wall biosynthesis
METIVIVRSNSIFNDERVKKIVLSLSKKYKVIVLGWYREYSNNNFDYLSEKILIKRLKLKGPYASFSIIFYYPLFWTWVFINLCQFKPAIIHSCDFDTIIPSYLYGKIFSTKIIFDSFDRYAMAFIPPKFKLIYTFVNKLEEIFAFNSDFLITVSRDRLDTFKNYKPKIFDIIMNCSNDFFNSEKTSKEISKMFSIRYAGGVTFSKGVLLVAKAIQTIPNIEFVIIGKTYFNIDAYLSRLNKIIYVGYLPHEKALAILKNADLIPVLFDPSIPNNQFANPNKLFEAMMLGIPVVSNVCKDILKETGCGLIVEYTENDVSKVIKLLMNDKKLCAQLGNNGHKAFELKYNWEKMEQKLFDIYVNLLR